MIGHSSRVNELSVLPCERIHSNCQSCVNVISPSTRLLSFGKCKPRRSHFGTYPHAERPVSSRCNSRSWRGSNQNVRRSRPKKPCCSGSSMSREMSSSISWVSCHEVTDNCRLCRRDMTASKSSHVASSASTKPCIHSTRRPSSLEAGWCG